MSAKYNKTDLGPEAANFIRKDFYVDDRLTSVVSVHDAVTLIKDTKEMCGRGGFKLQKITSSHKEVIEVIPIEDQAEGSQNASGTRLRDSVVSREGLVPIQNRFIEPSVHQKRPKGLQRNGPNTD